MLLFIAGASTTGAVVARYIEVRKSSAMPCANLPSVLAVAGGDQQQVDARGDGDVLDLRVGAGLSTGR